MLEPASETTFGEAPRRDDEAVAASPDVSCPQPASLPVMMPVHRIGAALEVILCSGFPTQLLLIGVLSSLGMRIQTEAGTLSSAFVFTISLLDTVLVVGLVLFFIRAHGESAREIFLGHRPILREALVGVILLPGLFLLVFVVLALILTFAPQLHNVARNPFEDVMQTRADLLAFGVVVTVAGGVREEIQRGFILRRFEQYLGGGLVGVVVFSAIFGLGHVEQGIDAALATAVLGAAWGTVYLLRRSIAAPMVSHAVFNLAQLLKYVALAVR